MIDLFCGTGGFADGFSTADTNYQLVYAIDADPHAVATARANHPSSRIDLEDIRAVDARDLKSEVAGEGVDLIVGGPPCQGFSSLRPNRASNTNDPRNSLLINFIDFVDVFRPKLFVLENVVGIVTHSKGLTLEMVLERFSALGYSVEWKIINAAHFGVPQKRERFVLVGSNGYGPISFPQPTHYSDSKVIGHRDRDRLQSPCSQLRPAVTFEDAVSDLPPLERGETADSYDSSPRNEYQRQRRAGADTLTLHSASKHSDKMLEVIQHAGDSIASIPEGLVTSGFSSSYSRMRPDEPANTITVKFQSPASSKCIHPHQARTITPREAARLQSFDDRYIFCGPMTHVASQLGNAVPPLLGRAISSAITPLMS